MNTAALSGGGVQEHFPAYRSKAGEKKGDLYEIEAIANELGRPLGEVADIYTAEYRNLRARALVTDYLPILVARRIRAYYQDKPPAVRDAVMSSSSQGHSTLSQ